MLRMRVLALCLAASLSATAQQPATSVAGQAAQPQPLPLAEQIVQILSAPEVARDHWGIYVTTLDGQPIYALNEAQLFQPASNAKLFTTTAALALLGPDYTFETKLSGSLNPTTHIIQGNLTLVGAGDPNFDSEDLPYIPPAARAKTPEGGPLPHQPNPMSDINDLVAQLVVKGVRQINGDIVGDDTLFPSDPYPQDWSIDDAVWGYGAPVTALTIADNELRLEIKPAPGVGQPASIALEQAVSYYSIRNQTRTVATKAEATGIQVERSIGSRTLRIYGNIALHDEPDVEHVAIDDPAEYAAMALRSALLNHGIAVNGNAKAIHSLPLDGTGFLAALNRPPVSGEYDCSFWTRIPIVSPLAVHKSQPLAAAVTYTNKVSQNLHAELMLHALAYSVPCFEQKPRSQGAKHVRNFLTSIGIDARDFLFFDGSGLSGHDLVTPRAVARLLSFATGQPWFSAFRASLPVGGEDGSLAQRFPNPPLKDHVFAKTGTLSEARALSGYLDAASGRTVIFSIMVGNHLPGTVDRDAMDKIVAAIQSTQ